MLRHSFLFVEDNLMSHCVDAGSAVQVNLCRHVCPCWPLRYRCKLISEFGWPDFCCWKRGKGVWWTPWLCGYTQMCPHCCWRYRERVGIKPFQWEKLDRIYILHGCNTYLRLGGGRVVYTQRLQPLCSVWAMAAASHNNSNERDDDYKKRVWGSETQCKSDVNIFETEREKKNPRLFWKSGRMHFVSLKEGVWSTQSTDFTMEMPPYNIMWPPLTVP